MDRRAFLSTVPVVAAARLVGKRTEKQGRTPLGCEKHHRQIEAEAAGERGLVWCEKCGLIYDRGTGRWLIVRTPKGRPGASRSTPTAGRVGPLAAGCRPGSSATLGG